MKKRDLVFSAILLIGICCMVLGFGNVVAYITNNVELTRWVGSSPMASSTSFGFAIVGLALFLIGKILVKHEQALRKN